MEGKSLMAMKAVVADLTAEKTKNQLRIREIDQALEGLRNVCPHPTEQVTFESHDSHHEYHECRICGKEFKH